MSRGSEGSSGRSSNARPRTQIDPSVAPVAIRNGSAKQRDGITLDVTVPRYVPTMSETALDMAQQLDRRVARCAVALRYLAYALFVGTLAMVLSNQLSYGNEVF